MFISLILSFVSQNVNIIVLIIPSELARLRKNFSFPSFAFQANEEWSGVIIFSFSKSIYLCYIKVKIEDCCREFLKFGLIHWTVTVLGKIISNKVFASGLKSSNLKENARTGIQTRHQKCNLRSLPLELVAQHSIS